MAVNFEYEDQSSGIVCGLDEVGRGPLAGPVVAACVHIPPHKRSLAFVSEIQDSKKLSEKKLIHLAALIRQHFDCTIAACSPVEIDEMNILSASLEAMKRAFEMMPAQPAFALVDGNRAPQLPCPAETVVKGDSKSISIAAASILAKAHRDALMKQLAQEFPQYGWENNVGYPSKAHLAAIDLHGITPHHRTSFAPVRNYIEFGAVKPQIKTHA